MDMKMIFPSLVEQGFDFSVIDQALAKLNDLAAKVVELDEQMCEVQEQGIVEATPYWRENTKKNGQVVSYLYLIHPQKDGKRKREYIGVDPSKQQVALCMVENFERFHELQQRHRNARNAYLSLSNDFRYTLQRIAAGRRW